MTPSPLGVTVLWQDIVSIKKDGSLNIDMKLFFIYAA